jgi:hypothetical protein
LNPLSGFRSIFSSTVWGPFQKVEWPFQWVFYFSIYFPFPFFLVIPDMEQVFRPLGFTLKAFRLHPKENSWMIFFIPYHIGYICFNRASTFAMHNQSCLSPDVSQHLESWSPTILLLLGTSSSLLQMGLLVIHIRISHKSHLNHFVVMPNMMSKLSSPLLNNAC